MKKIEKHLAQNQRVVIVLNSEELDDFLALREACNDYHVKHSKGAGGAAICVCGASSGGSKACRALSRFQTFFQYSKWGDPNWEIEYEKLVELLTFI